MTIRVAIYGRSSPDCPLSADEQIERLKIVAGERRWPVMCVHRDRPTSVRKGVDRRPGEMALIDAIRSGSINRVLIWSVCRIGKSLVDLVAFTETCRSSGVAVHMLEQGIDTEQSDMLFAMAAVMATHLRQSRRDRILRGQAMARSLSVRFGRPPIPTAKIEKAKHFLAMGKGVREAARLAGGISPSSVSRIAATLRSTTTI